VFLSTTGSIFANAARPQHAQYGFKAALMMEKNLKNVQVLSEFSTKKKYTVFCKKKSAREELPYKRFVQG
jgi:hypothetical protein